MKSYRTLGSVAVVLSLVLFGLGSVLSQSLPIATSGTTPAGAGPNIVFVGSPAGMAGETLAALRSRFAGSVIEVTQLVQLPAVATQIHASSIVLLDSEWVVGKIQETALLDFLKEVLPTQAKIVSIGGSTSLLFDSLEQVRNGIFAEGRNPAADNPPLAGYKLKAATTPDGMTYYGDSILIGYPRNGVSAADSILNWG